MGVYYKPFFKLPTFLLGNNEDKKSPPEITLLPVFLWSKQIVVVGSEGGEDRGEVSFLTLPLASRKGIPAAPPNKHHHPQKIGGTFLFLCILAGK